MSVASKASISDLNQQEKDDILNEDPNLTAADVKNATELLSDDIARPHQEQLQVDAVQHFILARSGYKRRHTRATTVVRNAIAKNAIGTRLSKTDLKMKREELISVFDKAIASHQSFINGIPFNPQKTTQHLSRLANAVRHRSSAGD